MSVVLVVGSPSAGKRSLVQALIGSLEPRSQDAERGAPDAASPTSAVTSPGRRVTIEPAGAVFETYPVNISTKYYTAQVALWRQADALSILALRSAEFDGLEGIIVVFDLCKESSWDEAEGWAAFVDDKEECAFRLCVGSKVDLLAAGATMSVDGNHLGEADSSAAQKEEGCHQQKVENVDDAADGAAEAEGWEERRRRCVEWCLDHGFEYVEADCRDGEKGGELREKEGVPRIVEALQSNVWTGMEFCTKSRPSALAAASRHRGGGGIGAVSVSTGEAQAAEEDQAESLGGEEDVSEYLAGFVDADGEHAGYGALNSGDDDDDDAEGNIEEAFEGREQHPGVIGAGDGSAERIGGTKTVPGDVHGDSSFAGRETVAPRDGVGVEAEVVPCSSIDPGHVELQARWEVADASSSLPANNGTPADGNTAVGVETQATGVANKSTAKELETPQTAPVAGSSANASSNRTPGVAGAGPSAEPGEASKESAAAGLDGGVVVGAVEEGGGGAQTAGTGGASGGGEEELLEAATAAVSGLAGDMPEVDEMELLMGEVRKAREMGSNVSDAERRARAADVAMRLAALLGEDGDSSEDDRGSD